MTISHNMSINLEVITQGLFGFLFAFVGVKAEVQLYYAPLVYIAFALFQLFLLSMVSWSLVAGPTATALPIL